jgi:DNA-binding NarL/FixJ family response regulator
MIKILIFEDGHKFRTSLQKVLNDEPDMGVVAAYEHAQKAVEQVKKHQPDVILMDLEMPKINGIEAIVAIKKEVPTAKIIVLTGHDEADKILAAIHAGAVGYLVKVWSSEFIIQQIRFVQSGKGAAFSPEVSQTLAKIVLQNQAEKPEPRFFDLSNREREVLCALVSGKDYQRIAESLKITLFGVNHHFKSIYRKLNVHSMPEAIRIAQDHQICA